MLKYGFLNQWAAKEVFPLAIEQGVGVLNMGCGPDFTHPPATHPGGRCPMERGWPDRARRLAGRRTVRLAVGRRRGLGDFRRLQIRRGPPGGLHRDHGHVKHRAFRGQRKIAAKAVVATRSTMSVWSGCSVIPPRRIKPRIVRTNHNFENVRKSEVQWDRGGCSRLQEILVHESGHSFGFSHTWSGNSIMRPEYLHTSQLCVPQAYDAVAAMANYQSR